MDKQAIMILILGVVIAFVIIGFLILIGHEGQGLLSGAFTTGTGLIASFLLAKRYFMAEYLFLLNVLMLTTYLISGQFTLMIIPMVYFANNIIFLVFNRVSDYE
ncbi:hypothetical protein [Pediococcus acidilactici]|uniref:hypothetical protein n=1 Tax=Pediococcus acidilactici TaxID=1254 RepID=UPI002F26A63C